MSYSNPIYMTTTIPAATISTAATVGAFKGPPGRKGRIDHCQFRTTTGVTVAADTLTIGLTGDTDAYLPSWAIGIQAAGSLDVATAAEIGAAVEIPADTDVLITAAGTSTAGAGDIVVVTAWY